MAFGTFSPPGRLIDMNEREATVQRAFGIRAVAAVTEIGIVSAHIIEDIQGRADEMANKAQGSVTVRVEHDPALMERERRATEEWRSVLAASQYHTSGNLAQALYEFDSQRSVVVDAVNRASTPELLAAAQRECEKLREDRAGRVYTLLQVDKLRSTARVYGLAHVVRLRRFAKSVSDALGHEMAKGEAMAERRQRSADAREHASS
ncbi:hypothetical protein GCM10022240_13280 [Microbacterium kribbense]|uniref:Uncharacterized protein n=1 Tax=Microbacterium kribbense TaxID=433645 RepID=A0ABP7GH09_9MICO